MKTLAFAAQMRELDRTAIEELHVPSLDLMERAALAVTEAVIEHLPKPGVTVPVYQLGDEVPVQEPEQKEKLRAAIFCGPGNNGGDGVAVARQLMERNLEVRAFLVGDRNKMTGDEKAMEDLLIACGGCLEDFRADDEDQADWLWKADCVVDALFGVGLCREVGGDFRTAIERINERRGPFCTVVACDVPSGVSADTGEILGAAVQADVTVTFTMPKPGLCLGEGGPCAGEIIVAEIGIPDALVFDHERKPDRIQWLDRGHYVLPRRSRTAHKGEFGKVFVLAGCRGYTGAPVFASRAAVRSGAGLVFLGVPEEIYPIAAVKCDEAMPFPLSEDYDKIFSKAQDCDVALIGPGLGRAPETERLVLRLLRDLEIPVVLDADGINAVSAHIDVLDARKAPTVLTPHDGEFQRLSGCALPIPDRLSAARSFAAEHHCVLILKGHGTITAAPDGRAYINGTGNPGMAKGGSGDVLAGLLAGLLGQKQLRGDLAELCAFGVYYHGQAGDRCAERLGEYGMTPADMLEELPYVLKEHTYQF